MEVKEILKTDSLAGSRIIINNNFNHVNSEISSINEFFIFDKNKRIGITSPIVGCSSLITNKIVGNDSLDIYKNELLCVTFNDDGEILIRKDGNCNLNVVEELSKLYNYKIDITGISNKVKNDILNDKEYITELTNELSSNLNFINTITTNVLNNSNFRDELIKLIEQYAPVPPTPPVVTCSKFLIYLEKNKIYVHCMIDEDSSKDMCLSDYIGCEEITCTFSREEAKLSMKKHYTDIDNNFVFMYNNPNDEKVEINKDGEFINFDKGTETFKINCEQYNTSEERYTLTKLQ
ncbi:hypothetical protein [uncultured Methanobrevibacter sp.]|uniref:hypothetical protein n=1 Tax=uncultured Methanobrevibacter sp. TaxID=253161 RepID=UPI0025F7B9F6|nr:hypothetical protein [uncultured Methanobrevibacter sp.]